jgi:hypothetical protein
VLGVVKQGARAPCCRSEHEAGGKTTDHDAAHGAQRGERVAAGERRCHVRVAARARADRSTIGVCERRASCGHTTNLGGGLV